jgi:hypothetical protein
MGAALVRCCAAHAAGGGVGVGTVVVNPTWRGV